MGSLGQAELDGFLLPASSYDAWEGRKIQPLPACPYPFFLSGSLPVILGHHGDYAEDLADQASNHKAPHLHNGGEWVGVQIVRMYFAVK